MKHLRLGIRGRINVALAGIICLATIAFGTGYAWIERSNLLEAEREHLHHLAALAEGQISKATNPDELNEILRALKQNLFDTTKIAHELEVTTAEGIVIATSVGDDGKSSPLLTTYSGEPGRHDFLLPSSIEVNSPLRFNRFEASSPNRQPARLSMTEPLDGLRQHILTSLLRHFLFAGGLVTITMLFVGAIVHRLVIRPVRELAAATEGIARDGDWDPVRPTTTRHNNEIGVLADRIATMSRRLAPAVRNERYGSAHLIAERVRRELEEPLRRVRIQLEILKAVATDSDEARACEEIDMAIQEIAAIGRRLGEVQSIPPV